jgi:hypothetical protein
MNVGTPHASVTCLPDPGLRGLEMLCGLETLRGPEMSVVTRSVCDVGSGRSAPSVAASLTEAFKRQGVPHGTKQ